MKKIFVLCMLVMALFSFGCGRNAQFGVVDMNKVQQESQVFKDATADLQSKGKAMEDELNQETAGKSQEEVQKIVQDKSAKMQALQADALFPVPSQNERKLIWKKLYRNWLTHWRGKFCRETRSW